MRAAATLLWAVALVGLPARPAAESECAARETFSEAVRMRRLPGRAGADPLAHLRFEFRMAIANVSAADAQHTSIFPLKIVQLLQARRVAALQLALTQGFWNEAAWAEAPPAPSGVELWAAIPTAEAEGTWGGLTNAMSGLFCHAASSLMFADTGQPSFFLKHRNLGPAHGRAPASAIVYAARQNEVVCIDHLRPFASLLPCRKTGFAAWSAPKPPILPPLPLPGRRLPCTQQLKPCQQVLLARGAAGADGVSPVPVGPARGFAGRAPGRRRGRTTRQQHLRADDNGGRRPSPVQPAAHRTRACPNARRRRGPRCRRGQSLATAARVLPVRPW